MQNVLKSLNWMGRSVVHFFLFLYCRRDHHFTFSQCSLFYSAMSTRGPRNRNNNNSQQSRSTGTRGNNAGDKQQQTSSATPATVAAVDATVPPRQRRKPQLLSRGDVMTTNTAPSQVPVVDVKVDRSDQSPPGLSMPPGLQDAVPASTNDEPTVAVVPTTSPGKRTTKSARLHYVPLFKKGDLGTAVVMLSGWALVFVCHDK